MIMLWKALPEMRLRDATPQTNLSVLPQVKTDKENQPMENEKIFIRSIADKVKKILCRRYGHAHCQGTA